MSRLSKYANKAVALDRKHSIINFMDGKSYNLDPMKTLEYITTSSIFGEKSYYRPGMDNSDQESTATLMENAIDDALDYDFKATLEFAVTLRNEYLMRLNPAIIFIRAAIHKDRPEFNKKNPTFMRNIGKRIIQRPDDITNQFYYYMYINGDKSGLPNIIKRIWASKLESFSRYQLSKYQRIARLIDLVRISHANSRLINEMMLSRKSLELKENESTWEKLRSNGYPWKDIINIIDMPHMALLRNIRNIFSENLDFITANSVLKQLEDGVLGGKQYPFRYYITSNIISNMISQDNRMYLYGSLIQPALSRCIDKSMIHFPTLKGKTICLSDNSGSAWGSVTSEYGTAVVANINNLSSFMTSINSDEGYVGYFGDRLAITPVNKKDGIINQLNKMDDLYGKNGSNYVGGGTETGIWLFFKDIIDNRIYYDNIFIYSDMQAGTGCLYGDKPEIYRQYSTNAGGVPNGIDILKLVEEYRNRVNNRVNIFSVQTAGYNNNILPQTLYRGALLTGWTGKETLYAKKIIDIWDSLN